MVSPQSMPSFDRPGVGPDGTIRRYSLAGLTEESPLLLAVYGFDFSPTCTRQLCDIRDLDWLALRDDLTVAGISGDGLFSHRRLIEGQELTFPLLSDPRYRLLETLDVLLPDHETFGVVPLRSLFLVAQDGTIHYRWIADSWDQWSREPLQELQTELETLQ